MAKPEQEDLREQMNSLHEESREKDRKKLESLQNQPEAFGLTPFVSEMILLESVLDDSGLISPDLLRFETGGFPKLPEGGGLDGGRIGVFGDEDTSKTPALSSGKMSRPSETSLPTNIAEYKFPVLDDYNVAELIELLKRVKARLPATKLKDLDLEEELVLHFLNLKELMTVILYDDEVPANQKAQIANSCASLLQQMTKSQSTIYSAERVKRMELALMKSLHGMPQEILEEFLERYEKVYSAEDM